MLLKLTSPVTVSTGLNGLVYVQWGKARHVLSADEASRLGRMLIEADPATKDYCPSCGAKRAKELEA
jgi:hypothetical protein